jgi:hypothetical protein
MKASRLLACVVLVALCVAAADSQKNATDATKAAQSAETSVDFVRDVKPIVSRCTPCHFEGGKMYGPMPFDKPETIHKLGVKLFTRIKDAKEQAVIKRFMESPK